MLDQATAAFALDKQHYEPRPSLNPGLKPLAHTYQRFAALDFHTDAGENETGFCFRVVPATEYFAMSFAFARAVERSRRRGVPFPKLDALARRLLHAQRYHDVEDLVDGMGLSEAWGDECLDLDGPVQTDYIRERNARTATSLVALGLRPALAMLVEMPRVREAWEDIVRGKEKRVDPSFQGVFEAQYRAKGAGDPRDRGECLW